MEIHLVDAVAVAVERAQHRRIFVGVEAELDRLRLAERGAEGVQAGLRPFGALALDALAQHGIAGERIIGLERRRLIQDFEHNEQVYTTGLAMSLKGFVASPERGQ